MQEGPEPAGHALNHPSNHESRSALYMKPAVYFHAEVAPVKYGKFMPIERLHLDSRKLPEFFPSSKQRVFGVYVLTVNPTALFRSLAAYCLPFDRLE